MRKKLLITTTVLFASLFVFTSIIRAQDSDEYSLVTTRQDWHADADIVSFEPDYNFPKSIKIVLINKKNSRSNSINDIRELYYYFASRSGFGDLPFHYLIAQDGEVYEGNSLGDEAKTTLTDEAGTIYIAYLIDGSDGLTIRTFDPLRGILLRIMNKYAISSGSLTVGKLTYGFGDRTKLTDIKIQSASSSWQEDLNLLKEELDKAYSPQEISYSLEVSSVTVPDGEIEAATTATVKLKIKNTGEVNIYPGSIFVSTKDDGRSSFYLNDKWDSFSRISVLSSSERLLKGEEKEVSIEIYVPLYPPEKSEEFVLRDASGDTISGTDFSVTLKIKNPDDKIIEILDTPTGFLNVRNTPGYGDVITKVSPGERFLVKAEENGYYKIDVNGKEGWVIRTYVKEIN